MKKRRHHYIWRKYLRAWSNSEIISCCRDGVVFNSNLKGIGQSRDFYKPKNLSTKEIAFINQIMSHSSSPSTHLQELNNGWIELFTLGFELKQLLNKNGVMDSRLEDELDEAIHNFEEELHSRIETNAIDYIESILNEDIGFYSTEHGYYDFNYYICVQYLRTKKIKSSISENTRDIGINFDNIWNVLSHIFATTMTWNLIANREHFKMVLLRNKSDKEIITGDQPVINTYTSGLMAAEPPEKLELYYPASPKLAILITKVNKFKNMDVLNLNKNEVEKYNQMIIKQSHSQIYATSKKVLTAYCVPSK